MRALRRWKAGFRRSLRLRLTALTTLLVAIALIGASFVLIELQRRALTNNLEETLQARADDIAASLKGGPLPDTLAVRDVEEALVQVVDDAGKVVVASANAAGAPPASEARPAPGETQIRRSRAIPTERGEAFILLTRGIEGENGPYTLIVAASLDPVDESIASLWAILRIGVPALILVVALGAWWLIGRALSPIEGIRAEVARIGERDLARRVPEPAGQDEVGRLARTMNEMLARLEEAARREERFVADAAHELRSPLASIRAQVETATLPSRESEADILAEIERMQRLVDDLLALAGSGPTAMRTAPALFDLDDVVLREVRRLRDRRGVTIDASRVSAAAVRGDPDGLARVVRNLLENAARHAQTSIAVDLREADGRVELAVSDDGTGVPAADRERVFERFTRLDAGRARDAGGAGLGLAISRAVVESHGGTINLDPAYEGGARFVVTIPAAAQRPGG